MSGNWYIKQLMNLKAPYTRSLSMSDFEENAPNPYRINHTYTDIATVQRILKKMMRVTQTMYKYSPSVALWRWFLCINWCAGGSGISRPVGVNIYSLPTSFSRQLKTLVKLSILCKSIHPPSVNRWVSYLHRCSCIHMWDFCDSHNLGYRRSWHHRSLYHFPAYAPAWWGRIG